ncbi:MAG: glycoside hydrolase family 3 N-terminal domain-containing protein [Sporichthyaceae bacterium]
MMRAGQTVVAAVAVAGLCGAWAHGVDTQARTEVAPVNAAAPLAPDACPAAADLSLRGAVAQTLMLGAPTPTRSQLRAVFGDRHPLGGLFLSGDSRAVLRDGRLKTVRTAKVTPLIAADDEGGRVQRLKFDEDLPSARRQAQMTPRQVRELAKDRGQALRRYGITMNLAPVVDLGGQARNAVIGDRSYGRKPATVVEYAGAFAAGLADAGVLGSIKHFPGHGRAAGDSHAGNATTPPASQLRAKDWVPFRELRDAVGSTMMGHLRVPGLSTPGLPSSLDPRLYRVLREEIGFRGLVITDELANMRAVRDRFGLREAIRRAVAAGADLALFFAAPSTVPGLLDSLVRDVRSGRLSEDRVREAAARVLTAKKACR